MNKIIPIPAFNDNYIWAILSPDEKSLLVVDPGDAKPVFDYLSLHNLNLKGILITHHHWDHTGGIIPLVKKYPNIPVYGPDNPSISRITQPLKDNDQISFKTFNLNFTILAIPGHTLDHIAYISDHYLFCGDTLFSAGCGRLFEGTANQMYNSLMRLKALPDKLKVYCAHEYTEANLNFALKVLPHNQILESKLSEVKALRAQNTPSLPSNLATEKQINLFLQCDNLSIAEKVRQLYPTTEINNPKSVFAGLRAWKDSAG